MNRAYYTDSYTLEFTSEIVAVVTLDGRPAVILDRGAGPAPPQGRAFHTKICRHAPCLAPVPGLGKPAYFTGLR